MIPLAMRSLFEGASLRHAASKGMFGDVSTTFLTPRDFFCLLDRKIQTKPEKYLKHPQTSPSRLAVQRVGKR